MPVAPWFIPGWNEGTWRRPVGAGFGRAAPSPRPGRGWGNPAEGGRVAPRCVAGWERCVSGGCWQRRLTDGGDARRQAEAVALPALRKRPLRDSPCSALLRAKAEEGESRHRRRKLFVTSRGVYLIHVLTGLNRCRQRCIRARACADIWMIKYATFGCNGQNSLQMISLWFSILQLAKVL